MSKVIIKECNEYNADEIITKINDGIEKLGGWESFLNPGDTVLLKVNLIGPKTSETAAVTHSEFVRAVVRVLKKFNCTVWIGDSSGGAIAGIAPTAQSMKVAGYEKVAEEEGAVIKNFDSEGVVAVKPKSKPEEQMYLAKPIFDADVVINLPKLKTHSSGIFTGAVKNVFGCIPGLRKAKYHRMSPIPEDFGHTIADIHQAAKFSLHIMDGIIAMQGEGPTAGAVYKSNKIIISTDPLALDTVAVKMLKMEVEDVPILLAARERGIGESRLEKISIEGDYDKIPILENFKLPRRFRSSKKRNYHALVRVIDFFKTRPRINLRKCKNCNMCVDSCPVEAIDRASKNIDYETCIECLCCHELCMHKAVDLKKENLLANIITNIFYRTRYKV